MGQLLVCPEFRRHEDCLRSLPARCAIWIFRSILTIVGALR
jgi:hypothetical protein